ncbi:MAG: hypothetical protein IKX28_07685 [Bacteroidales bacterium]|nr:hypothetical protein [Bacteroidales bacterium]
MASISDLILQQVKSATGGVQIPANLQSQVLNGMASSVLGSLTQTAAKPGGVDLIKNLLTGQTNAATSPVTALAGNIFNNNVLKKLGVSAALGAVLTGLIPKVMGNLSNIIKDRDGDGDVDLNDIILTLTGGGAAAAAPAQAQTASKSSGGLLGAATSILGGLLGRKK